MTADIEIARKRFASLGISEAREVLQAMTPRVVEPYVPHVPHPPQQAFLLQDCGEAFYGGAAGGGKSDALLMAAMQWADVPGYSALILRRNFSDLNQPGAIMDRANSWLKNTPARPRGGKSWLFPTLNPDTGERDFINPARLTFGYLQYHRDVEQYRGAEYQFIGIDEVTQFEERTYRFLFSRLRGPALPCLDCGHPASKLAGAPWTHDEGHPMECGCGDFVDLPPGSPIWELVSDDDVLTTANPDRSGLAAAEDGNTLADVPIRMRTASNPGGLGHAWARDTFVDAEKRKPGVVFIPARIEDNPSLDRRAYRQTLRGLSALEAARLEQGDWDVADEGEVFKRHWFEMVPSLPRLPGNRTYQFCRAWDLAATAAKKGKDPDWTCGALLALDKATATWFLLHMARVRGTPLQVEQLVVATAEMDRRKHGNISIVMEQEPGSSGVNTISTYRRMLLGHDFRGKRVSTSKLERARPWSRSAEAGDFKIVDGPWNQAFLDEVAGFPSGTHDDQVDAVSLGVDTQAFGPRARILA